MRFAASVATVIGASVARLLRPLGSASPHPATSARPRTREHGTRYAVTALTLALGLQGSALCLCAPRPVRNAKADAHSCCPKPTGHDRAKTPGTAINASDGCCAAQMSVPDVVARLEAREPVRQPLTFVAAAYIPPAAAAAPSTVGASASFARGASPPLTPVLRI